MENLVIGQKNCIVKVKGDGGPILLWGTFLHPGESIEESLCKIEAYLEGEEYVLCAFLVDDWFGAFSPWQDFSLGEMYTGGGRETLTYIEQELLPFLQEKYRTNGEVCLAGYSLAGLFALWAGYESSSFTKIACVSGSLWMPGWDTYVQDKCIHAKYVYLSLGGKEEKTKHPKMAAIGERMKAQLKHLQEAQIPCFFELNPGGHFAGVDKRMGKAFLGMLHEKT